MPVQLEEERHGVDAEAGEVLGQPEADQLADLVADLGRGDVEVRLVAVEAVQVVLAGLGVPGPEAALVAGEDLALRAVGGDLVGPDVEVAEPRLTAAASRLEPGVLVGGVVDDEVDDHPHAAVACRARRTR